jgi:hypothetical protein
MAEFNKEIFKVLRVVKFITEYTELPYTAYMKHKIRGIDGNKQPIELTPQEINEIIRGLHTLGKKLSEIEFVQER